MTIKKFKCDSCKEKKKHKLEPITLEPIEVQAIINTLVDLQDPRVRDARAINIIAHNTKIMLEKKMKGVM
jgi:hypothetical protein